MKWILLLAAWRVLAPAAYGHPRLPVAPPPSAERQLADHVRRLESATEDERLQGVRGIKELGPAGLPAVAVLVRTFRESLPAGAGGHRGGARDLRPGREGSPAGPDRRDSPAASLFKRDLGDVEGDRGSGRAAEPGHDPDLSCTSKPGATTLRSID